MHLPAVYLAGDEAHHLLHVLRAGVGDEIVLFDGYGSEATARVLQIGHGRADLEILDRRQLPPDTTVPIVLGTAVPKGDRFDWLVEKATELGVTRLVPLETEHSVVVPGLGKLQRLQGKIISASKQCGRNWLMELCEPIPWRLFVEQECAAGDAYIAHPGGDPVGQIALPTNKPIVLAIGPEGGFSDDEITLARQHGGRVVTLGPRLLRIETAAVAMAALVGLR